MAHHGESPRKTPPKGSRLAYLRNLLEEARGLDDSEPATDEPMGGLGTWCPDAPLLDIALWGAPELLVSIARKWGMPADQPMPPWLRKMLEFTVALWRAHTLANPPEYLLPPKPRAGRPTGGDPYVDALIVREYLRQRDSAPPDASRRSIYKSVAERLGPGLKIDHIRRAVERYQADLSGLLKADIRAGYDPMQGFASVYVASIGAVGRSADELERRDSFPRRRA